MSNKWIASKRLRDLESGHAHLASTNSESVQESRSGVMRGREMPKLERIQTLVQFLFSYFGILFWQTVYRTPIRSATVVKRESSQSSGTTIPKWIKFSAQHWMASMFPFALARLAVHHPSGIPRFSGGHGIGQSSVLNGPTGNPLAVQRLI